MYRGYGRRLFKLLSLARKPAIEPWFRRALHQRRVRQEDLREETEAEY